MLAAWLAVVVGVCAVGFYGWYLTWPVVQGQVIQGSGPAARWGRLRGFRRRRLITFEYECGGTGHRSRRQNLFAIAALGPRVTKGQTIKVSQCKAFPDLSSPYRPFFDGFLLLNLLSVCGLAALLYRFPA